MELLLRPEEAALLLQILTTHLADLRTEIVRTDRYALRQALKQDQALLKGVQARLAAELPAGGNGAGVGPLAVLAG